MTITPSLFGAFLKCPTKCWLQFTGKPPSGNSYAEWLQTQNDAYRDTAARLLAEVPANECEHLPRSSQREEAHYWSAENLKSAKWKLELDSPMRMELRSSRGHAAQISSPEVCQSLLTSAATVVESRRHAIERIPSENRDQLFTFLEHDGVPWNNNNAEHAIKAVARLRNLVTGLTTEKGLKEYLVLLSVSQTCDYLGVDFLDFLRSGEKDIHAFAESRHRRRRQRP